MTSQRDPSYFRDGHRLVAQIAAFVYQSGRSVADMQIVIECPGEGRCEAPLDGGGCNLKEWVSCAGIHDFVEAYAEVDADAAPATLPTEIEWRWEGWGEDAEPRFRAVTDAVA